MTNREKLLKINIYDVLCDMNKNLLNKKLLNANPYGVCVIKALNADYDCCDRCAECIARWLNEEV